MPLPNEKTTRLQVDDICASLARLPWQAPLELVALLLLFTLKKEIYRKFPAFWPTSYVRWSVIVNKRAQQKLTPAGTIALRISSGA